MVVAVGLLKDDVGSPHGSRLLVSKVNKPSKFLIKTSSATEYIELYIQNIDLII